MFEAIIDQLKQQLADVLKDQHNLSQPDAEKTAEAAGKSLVDIVKQQVSQKDFSTVNEALSGTQTDASHPAVQNLINPLGENIAERTGIDTTKALAIASSLLPFVFNMFNDQVQQAKSKGIDVQDMVKKVAGGDLNMANMGSFMSLATTFMKNKTGKSNGVSDVLSKFL